MRGIFLLADYPDRQTFLCCVEIVKKAGFDFIEIGLPYSDPVADGEVIRLAMSEVLKDGFSIYDFLNNCFELTAGKASPMRVYIMTYSNVLFKIGVENFNHLSGLNGLIIADLPNRMHSFFYRAGLKIPVIPFVTPESKEKHIGILLESRGDFVYFVGIRGVTGSSVDYSFSFLNSFSERIKRVCSRPVVVGFGIRDAKTALIALESAGGYVVGTEAVKRQKDPVELKKFLLSLPG